MLNLPRHLAGTLLMGAAFIVACSGSGTPESDDVSIQPIDQILVGEIRIGRLTSTSAVVEVETSIDVVCSVVFGMDSSYGEQATDLDMGGGAHRMHAAPMRALQPETEYHYRLQGAGPDGTIYVSEPMTFRTPAAEARAPEATNLAGASAGARVVAASSVFGNSPTWAAEHAIDGDESTEWSAAGEGDRAHLTIELAERSAITSIGVWTRTMGTTAQIESFQVVVDGERVLGPFELPDAGAMHRFALDDAIQAQTLRFEVVTSSGGNTGLVEFAAFGDSR